uniref:Uncharacterized protein n=1 Tax=viral metagenome TaxID=1070528 RepID=A0A2V0RAV4_9ZZZZ
MVYIKHFHGTLGNNVKQIKLTPKERGIIFSRYGNKLFHRFNEGIYRSLLLLRADKEDSNNEGTTARQSADGLYDKDTGGGKLDNSALNIRKPLNKDKKPKKMKTPPMDPPPAQGAESIDSQIRYFTDQLIGFPVNANTINGYKRPRRINSTIYIRFLTDTDSLISQSFRRVVVERIWNSTRSKLLKKNSGLTKFFASLDFLEFFWRSAFNNTFNVLVVILINERRISCSSKLSEIKTYDTRLDFIRGRTIGRVAINSRVSRRIDFLKSFVRQLALPPTLVDYAIELATTYACKVGQVEGFLDQSSFNIKFINIDGDGKPKFEEVTFYTPEFMNENGFTKEWDDTMGILYNIAQNNVILELFIEECSQCFNGWELTDVFGKFERKCGHYDVRCSPFSCQKLLRQNSFIGYSVRSDREEDYRKKLCDFGHVIPFRVTVADNQTKNISFKELLFSDVTFNDEVKATGLIYKYIRGRFPGAFYYKSTNNIKGENHVSLFNLDIAREICSDGFVRNNQRDRLYDEYYDRSVYESIGFCSPGKGYSYFHPTLGWVFADLTRLESLVDNSLADIFECNKEKNWIEDVKRIIVADDGNRSFSFN